MNTLKKSRAQWKKGTIDAPGESDKIPLKSMKTFEVDENHREIDQHHQKKQ